MKVRCAWARGDLLYIDYHDTEWGVPQHDDRKLFEFLVLEGAQAGLSWLTMLRKRANYRESFDNFDVGKVAAYDTRKLAELLSDRKNRILHLPRCPGRMPWRRRPRLPIHPIKTPASCSLQPILNRRTRYP